MKAKCWNYNAKDLKAKENCPNCHNWVGPQCIDHLKLLKEQKFREIDILMRSNKGVYLG